MTAVKPDDVARVLGELPDLGVLGFADPGQPPQRATAFGADFVGQVDTAVKFIRARGLALAAGSYTTKHQVERTAGRYVSNGALIVAAVLTGHRPVRHRQGPNCKFERAS